MKKKLILVATVSTISTVQTELKADWFSGISEAFDKTVEFSKNAVDSTKEVSKNAIDKTSEISNNVVETTSEKSREAWDKTSETSKNVADKTTEVSTEAWNKTAETSKNVADKTAEVSTEAWNKTSEATKRVANSVRENAPLYWEKSVSFTKDHSTEIIIGAIIIVAVVHGIPPQAMTLLDLKSAIDSYSNNKLNYSSLMNQNKAVEVGKELTKNEMNSIIAENMKQHGGVVKSDLTGKILQLPKNGIPTSMTDVVIDYVVPLALGGTNDFSNVQILSKEEALRKTQLLADRMKDKK